MLKYHQNVHHCRKLVQIRCHKFSGTLKCTNVSKEWTPIASKKDRERERERARYTWKGKIEMKKIKMFDQWEPFISL